MRGLARIVHTLISHPPTPSLATRSFATGAALVMEKFGVPEQVLRLNTDVGPPSPESLGDHDVLINILAVRQPSTIDHHPFLFFSHIYTQHPSTQAPINPSDINTIEGKYPLHPDLPASPGHEGVGVVAAVGSKVTRLRPGDRCVPIEHSQGTWRTHGVFDEHHWYRIPSDLPIAAAANMVINPPTAIRLLEEYVTLEPGDVIIQTGSTSAVGKYVLQMATHRGIKSINLIRDRPAEKRAQVEHELKEMGATAVVTPSELPALLKTWPHNAPKLALDCVAGEAATAAVKALAPGGTLVVYGSMSREPVTIPSGHLIFKDIRVRGFWLTGGYAKMKEGWRSKERLVDQVCALFRQKVIKPVTVDCVPLTKWEEALHEYRRNHRDAKVMLTNYGDEVCL